MLVAQLRVIALARTLADRQHAARGGAERIARSPSCRHQLTSGADQRTEDP